MKRKTSLWNVQYEGRLKSSYDDIIFAVDDFLANGIQALQHQWQKYVDHKGNYIVK